jgi:hypothetical protein
MRALIALLALTISAGTLRAEQDHSFWWYTKAKIACLPDVMRLCGSSMPSEDKVRDCMKNKQKLVSADCAEFYPGGKNAE